MADGTHDELEDLGGLTTSIGQLDIENATLSSTRRDQNDLQDDGTDDFWFEHDLSNDILDDGSSHASVLNREGRFRYNKNHTLVRAEFSRSLLSFTHMSIENRSSQNFLNHDTLDDLTKFWMGYRDGITAGKEASAQEGFNIGFRQSVHVGHRWGLVRGITSALAGLSDSSREKLVSKFENRDSFLNLNESVQAISANDALKMYYNSILQNGSMQSHDHSEGDAATHDHSEGDVPVAASFADDDSSSNTLENLYKDLISLLHETPEISVNVIKTLVG